MSDPSKKDRNLDAYLRGDSPLSKAYKEDARELPPAHVDAQILAQAHRADGGPRKKPARSPFSGSWMVPASVTAVVVLAVSVVVLLPQGRQGHEPPRDRFEDTVAPETEPTGTGNMRQRESNQAPAPRYAPAPQEALQFDQTPSGAGSPEDGPVAPAQPSAPSLKPQSVTPREARPSAPAAARSDADAAPGSVLKRAAEKSGTGPAVEEEVAGSVRSEAVFDADAWLEHIKSLIDRGELAAARESLGEFRRHYPRIEVPQGIIEALEGD